MLFIHAKTADMYCAGVWSISFLHGFLIEGTRMNSSGETPKKISISSGCLICGTGQSDSRKKTSLKGKVSDLAGRVAAVLDIDPNTVDVERYLCNDRCYKRIKRLEKSQEEARLSKDELKANIASTNRVKRGVPSDSFLSPSTVAPTKSASRIDQSTSGPKKTLKFTTTEDVCGKSPLPDIMPLVGLQCHRRGYHRRFLPLSFSSRQTFSRKEIAKATSVKYRFVHNSPFFLFHFATLL